jgi:hypothetical protein
VETPNLLLPPTMSLTVTRICTRIHIRNTPTTSNRSKRSHKNNMNSIMTNTSTLLFLCFSLITTLLTCAVVSALDCIDDLQVLHDREARAATSSQRTYVLCPNKIYEVGYLDFNYNLRRQNRDDAGPPIPLRPNLHVKCGENGLRKDNCWIVGGHLQVDGTAIRGITDRKLDNVVIEGLTFQSSIDHSVWITKPGSITFKQCGWTDHTNSRGPVMLDFYDDVRPTDTLKVQFLEVLFHGNRYFGNEAQAAMIVANSDQNIIDVQRTVFQSINMKHNNTDNRPTYLVESLGRTTIQQSCFINNQVMGSAVAVYGTNQLVTSDIHLSDSSGDLCSFASVFETLQMYQQQKPRCVYGLRQDCPWLMDDGYSGTGGGDSGGGGNGDDDDDGMNGGGPVRRYAPFAINALDYDGALEVDTEIQGSCSGGQPPIDGPDAQNNFVDAECQALGPCNIGFSVGGERVLYRYVSVVVDFDLGDIFCFLCLHQYRSN